MRPSASLLRFSLVLNACLLFSYGVWYMHQSTVVGFVPEPTAQVAPVARTVVETKPTTTPAAAAETTEAAPPQAAAQIDPHCALSQLRQCSDVTPRTHYVMRGTKYWVLYNFVIGERRVACNETVTYTTHGDFTFLDNIVPLVLRWRAPVSFALYAPADDFIPSVEALSYLRFCADPLARELVTFHVVFDVDKVPLNVTNATQLLQRQPDCSKPPPWVAKESYRKAKHLTYPVNVLRNVARETVMTHYVLPSDVELYPSEGLAEQFIDMVRRNAPVLCRPQPRVYVLSIFEVAANHTPPLHKDQLTGMLKNGTAIPFHKYMCPTCHRIPKAKEWTFSKETQQMDVFHVGKRHPPFEKWEPIYICTNQEPAYDERLTWEGKMDKMGQGYTLCIQDYDFMILNNAFLVHKPGIKKYKPDKWRDTLVSKQRRFILSAEKLELERMFGRRKQCNLS
ncbi:beta-1,4-glucuronyltransferase 1-like [Amphibalanus amphitrite]|uniref:beta-1,4-glucuronyltransferase 1-like n=1 Tax=Amphibalanus amphitrite TaxID=1232801 RepID=UPI001C91544C|nr:beta-1,4-glucuronyltransferase 1-like [Amphibalanus amphitrite]